MVTRAAVCLSLRRTLSELWVVERVLAMEAVVTMVATRVAVTVVAAPEEARGAAKAVASEVAPAAARATAAMEVVAMEVVVMEVVDGVAETVVATRVVEVRAGVAKAEARAAPRASTEVRVGRRGTEEEGAGYREAASDLAVPMGAVAAAEVGVRGGPLAVRARLGRAVTRAAREEDNRSCGSTPARRRLCH